MSAPKASLRRRIESRLRQRLGLPNRWVATALLGESLIVREGTIPSFTDYDDAWFFACAQHAEVILDVGANVGHSALMALLCPNVREVVLIEANWEALSVAAQNLVRNRLSERVRFVSAFASDANNDSVSFWTVGTGAAGSMYQGHAKTAARAGDVRQVSTTTLDTICARYAITPDLVKIDVEGAEAKVLGGFLSCAAAGKTRFIVEMHAMPELSMTDNASLVLEWAHRAGYLAWYLSAAQRLDSPQAIAHRGRCHLLLQPADWPYPAWLAGIPQSAPLPSFTGRTA